MIDRRGLAGVLGAVALIVTLVGCGLDSKVHIFGVESYRYRLIVEVETPVGLRSGSSVIEVVRPFRSGSFARGEAVAIDLPNNQTLFVLLRSQMMSDWADKAPLPAFPSVAPTDDHKNDVIHWIQSARAQGRTPLPRRWQLTGPNDTMDHTPFMARFSDINAPGTMEQVDPDNLVECFGAGVKLKGIFVEITDAPVTRGIEKRLHWVRERPGSFINLSRNEREALLKAGKPFPFANTIIGGDFILE